MRFRLIVISIFFALLCFFIFSFTEQTKAFASANPSVEQQINIWDFSSSGASVARGIALIDTSAYSGTVSYYFEVVAQIPSGSGTAVLTYNAGTGSTISGGSTATISNITATSYTRYRSSAITPAGIQNAYVSSLTGSVTIKAARVIIVQTDPNFIKNSVTQIEIGNNESTVSSIDVALTHPKYWMYNPTKYDGTVKTYFEVTLQNSSGNKVSASLYPSGVSCSGQVAGSQVTTDTSGSWQRLRTADISGSLVSGTIYMVCFHDITAGTALIANAHLIIQQTSNGGLTKMELQNVSLNQAQTASTSAYTSKSFFYQYNPSDWNSGTFTYYFGATLKTTAGTGYAQLYNSTDGSAVSGSEISTSNISDTLIQSASITMPSATKDMDTRIKNSASNTTTIEGSWLIIDVTNLSQIPNTPTSLHQYRNDGVSMISNGSWTSDGISNNVVFNFLMSSPNSSDILTPEIELEPSGTSFSGIVNYTGIPVSYTGTAVTGTVTVTGLTNCAGYHWQTFILNTEGISPPTIFNNSSPNFSVTSISPTGSTVYDGSTNGSETSTALSTTTSNANWNNFTDSCSGLAASPYQTAIGTTSGGTDIQNYISTGITSGNPNTYKSTNLLLSIGTTYYISVKATNNAGLSTIETSSGISIVAIPNNPQNLFQYNSDGSTIVPNNSWVSDGATTNLIFKFSMSSLNPTDTLTPEVEIEPTGTVFTGTPNYTGDSVAFSGTAVTGIVNLNGLTDCNGYHWQAIVMNSYGTSSPILYNSMIPNFSIATVVSTISTVYDGAVNGTEVSTTSSTTTLDANWTNFTDTCSGLPANPYEVAIGTTSGGTDILDYTSTGITSGTVNNYTDNNLSLNEGTKYYISVRATNNGGLTNTATSSGVLIAAVSLPSITATTNTLTRSIHSNVSATISNGKLNFIISKVQPVQYTLTPNSGNSPSSISTSLKKVSPLYFPVRILVLDTNNKPVQRAVVVLHSVPQTSVTDENGIATFSKVEEGSHTILITYNGLSGQKQLDIRANSQSVQSFNITVKLQSDNVFIQPPVIIIGALSTIVILILSILLIKSKSIRNT